MSSEKNPGVIAPCEKISDFYFSPKSDLGGGKTISDSGQIQQNRLKMTKIWKNPVMKKNISKQKIFFYTNHMQCCLYVLTHFLMCFGVCMYTNTYFLGRLTLQILVVFC